MHLVVLDALSNSFHIVAFSGFFCITWAESVADAHRIHVLSINIMQLRYLKQFLGMVFQFFIFHTFLCEHKKV